MKQTTLAETVQYVFEQLQDKIDARGPIAKSNLQHYVNLLRDAFEKHDENPINPYKKAIEEIDGGGVGAAMKYVLLSRAEALAAEASKEK